MKNEWVLLKRLAADVPSDSVQNINISNASNHLLQRSMKKSIIYSLIFFLVTSSSVFSQSWQITGQVSNGYSLPPSILPGNRAEFASSMDISQDGKIAVFGDRFADVGGFSDNGQIAVFEYDASLNEWFQYGNNVPNGRQSGDLLGHDVSINADGSKIAASAYLSDQTGTDAGEVIVYHLDGSNNWVPYGNQINMRGEASGDNFGWSVAISGDGNRVAVGARLNDGNGTKSGHVRVFEYDNLTSTWVQVGADIDGEAADDRLGYSISINYDGTIVVAGARFNDGNGTSSGHVRVYQETGGVWSQVGADIDGEAAGDNFGHSVALDSAGNTFVAGAVRNDGNGTSAGHVRVYENVAGTWTQVGSDLDGLGANVRFGEAVDLSYDGKMFIASEPDNPSGAGKGQARMYRVNGSSISQMGIRIKNQAGAEDMAYDVSISNNATALMSCIVTTRVRSYKFVCTPSFGTDTQTVCDSLEWIDGNTYYTDNNTAKDTIFGGASSGCDSIVTLDLTIVTQTSGTDLQTACDTYTWPLNGVTYTSSTNSPTATLTNAAGCDSVVTLNLTISNSTAGTDAQTACDTYTWPLNGVTYTSSTNSPTATLTNAAGCDSVVTLNLTISNSTAGIDVQTSCDSYTWIDGNTYTSSNNTATQTLTNTAGCDSVVTLDLTILNSTSSTDARTECDSYTWIDGNTYTSSNNTATQTLTNAAGCDSVVTLDLTILNSTSSTDAHTECDSYTWIDGNTYTSSNNTATHVLTNAAGCDSVVTLDLTINQSTSSTDVLTTCDNQYTWIDGNTYTSNNNTATHVLMNAAGCDSTVTLDLTFLNSTTGIDTRSECDSYTWIDGNTYTSSNNTATHTLTNAAGCDSVVTLDLTILNSTSGVDTRTECDSYVWIDGNTYTSSNNNATHTIVGAAANGCDSVVTLDLTILNSTSSTDAHTECDSYTWIDGNTYTSSNNSATHVLTNAAGCDSVVTLDLTINQSTTSTDVLTTCDGSYTWIDGNTYTSSNNTATHIIVNAAGCDSTITLDLTFTDIDTSVNASGATFTANMTGASYQWLDCDNAYTPIAGETAQSFTASVDGNYAVEVSKNGCVDTSACMAYTNVGINSIEHFNEVSVYPNPANNVVSLETNNEAITQVRLLDITGKEIKTFNPANKQLNVADLSRGIYFLEISNTEKRSIVKLALQ